MVVRTNLDPREAIRRLRALRSSAPGAFRFTYKWVPVDLWSAHDVASLREAVTRLRHRIAPRERWRITVERRARGCAPAPEIIAAVADLVEAKVDLVHPDKVLLIEVFDASAALAVVAPDEVLSLPVQGGLQCPRSDEFCIPPISRQRRGQPSDGRSSSRGHVAPS
jgi:tRNA(Ser,Leu) C12 N-acetylase TAN1